MCDLSLSLSCNLHLHHLRFGLPILHPPPAGPISIYPAFSWTQRVGSPVNVTLEECTANLSGHLLKSNKNTSTSIVVGERVPSLITQLSLLLNMSNPSFPCRGTSGICCGVSEIGIASDKWESRSVLGQIVLFLLSWNQDFEGFRHSTTWHALNSPKDPVFSSAHFFGVRMTKKPADQQSQKKCRSIAAFSASAHLVPYLHVGVFSGQNWDLSKYDMCHSSRTTEGLTWTIKGFRLWDFTLVF